MSDRVSESSGVSAVEEDDAPSLELRRLQTEAFLNFGRLHRALDACVGTLFSREGLEGITPAQSALLMVLFQARRPLTARELAEHQGLSQPTIGRFVKALQTQGWVSREADPTDARAILIRPTRKARRCLPRFIAVSNAMLDRAFEGFTEVAIRRVASTTRRLRENLEAAELKAAESPEAE